MQYIIFVAGFGQLAVLLASALVPIRLNWKNDLMVLPRLHRQLYWVYGGYVVLAIIALGLVSILNAAALASGTLLARCVCGYTAAFWGIRLSLQAFLDVKCYLTASWLRAGYHLLTVLFAAFTMVFSWVALAPSTQDQTQRHGDPGSDSRGQTCVVTIVAHLCEDQASRHNRAGTRAGGQNFPRISLTWPPLVLHNKEPAMNLIGAAVVNRRLFEYIQLR